MSDFRVAAKAFIVFDGKLLLIKRRPNDVHKPAQWDIPGGRLELGESPYEGLLRETKEETGLEIEIIAPLHIQHFTRDDGQKITMMVFVCRPKGKEVKLSEEHVEYKWTDTSDAPEWLKKASSFFEKYYKGKV